MNKNTVAPRIAAKDLRSDLDLTNPEALALLELALHVKAAPGEFRHALADRSLGLLFEKPSLRTRFTFELAIKRLGGDCVTQVGRISEREPVKDVARNVERWCDGIVCRTFYQETVEELARYSRVPVVNALSDRFHPCQALADVLTLRERFGGTRDLKLAYVGDGFNVAHSLLITCARVGTNITVAAPNNYQPKPEIVRAAERLGDQTGARVTITDDPSAAVRDAHAVYTDVWFSMGEEVNYEQRLKDFAPYRVTEELFAQARPDAIFLHCLPAKRNEETTDAMMEHPRSAIFDQAENRLHAQKALLLMLLGSGN
jgi:ornithine carbamoyltransferase